MATQSSPKDKGVSIAVPEGYSHQQLIDLASALYTRFYWDHEGFAFKINKDRDTLTVFSVN
jgi:hypothetical protein